LNRKIKTFCAITILLLSNCAPDFVDDPIPIAQFPDFTITVSNHPSLLIDGGFIYRSEGVRGLIIYRKNGSTFLAFERNCTFQPNDVCATIEVHSSSLYIFDPCCGSTFNFDGNPTGSPASRPLRQYQTSWSAGTNTITVTDQIIQ
jgi:Rieske Fe-S protein